MNHSMPGLPVHHQLPEFTQTHAHQVGDAIQPSHPLLSPSPPAPNPSQHQGLFQWVNSAWGGQNIGVSALASVLPMNTQDWSPLGWTDWISLQSKGLPRVFSNTMVQKHQFFSAQLSSQSNYHIHAFKGFLFSWLALHTYPIYFVLHYKVQCACDYIFRQEPAHETPPMTRSWGENLKGKMGQVFRDFEKLPPALTLKMISVFLILASIDYSLISVTQAEGLPWSLSK